MLKVLENSASFPIFPRMPQQSSNAMLEATVGDFPRVENILKKIFDPVFFVDYFSQSYEYISRFHIEIWADTPSQEPELFTAFSPENIEKIYYYFIIKCIREFNDQNNFENYCKNARHLLYSLILKMHGYHVPSTISISALHQQSQTPRNDSSSIKVETKSGQMPNFLRDSNVLCYLQKPQNVPHTIHTLPCFIFNQWNAIHHCDNIEDIVIYHTPQGEQKCLVIPPLFPKVPQDTPADEGALITKIVTELQEVIMQAFSNCPSFQKILTPQEIWQLEESASDPTKQTTVINLLAPKFPILHAALHSLTQKEHLEQALRNTFINAALLRTHIFPALQQNSTLLTEEDYNSLQKPAARKTLQDLCYFILIKKDEEKACAIFQSYKNQNQSSVTSQSQSARSTPSLQFHFFQPFSQKTTKTLAYLKLLQSTGLRHQASKIILLIHKDEAKALHLLANYLREQLHSLLGAVQLFCQQQEAAVLQEAICETLQKYHHNILLPSIALPRLFVAARSSSQLFAPKCTHMSEKIMVYFNLLKATNLCHLAPTLIPAVPHDETTALSLLTDHLQQQLHSLLGAVQLFCQQQKTAVLQEAICETLQKYHQKIATIPASSIAEEPVPWNNRNV